MRLEEPQDEGGSLVGVGVKSDKPITAMRAILEFQDAEVVDSKYKKILKDGTELDQKQFACTLKVISGAGERNGETFYEWLSFEADNDDISAKTKTGQVLRAALGEDAKAETFEELAKKLIGARFAAQIGTSKDGQYSRIVPGTAGPAPNDGRSQEDGSGSGGAKSDDLGEDELKDIPW